MLGRKGTTIVHYETVIKHSICPMDIAVGQSDLIYIVDRLKSCIQCFRHDGTFVRKWGRYGSEDGEFMSPTGIDIGIYDDVSAAILTALNQVGVLRIFPPGLLPICAKYIGDEHIYLADTVNHRIQVFNCCGQFIRKWGAFGSDNGQFRSPHGCALGVNGKLYVCDSDNARVQVFDSDGTFLSKCGQEGEGDGEFKYPWGIAVSDAHGLIFVTDGERDIVQSFTLDGVFVTKWGGTGTSSGMFAGVEGVIMHEDIVYVGDAGNHRLQQFRADGTFIGVCGGNEGGARHFSYPRGIAKGTEGAIYIADCWNNRIVRMKTL